MFSVQTFLLTSSVKGEVYILYAHFLNHLNKEENTSLLRHHVAPLTSSSIVVGFNPDYTMTTETY